MKVGWEVNGDLPVGSSPEVFTEAMRHDIQKNLALKNVHVKLAWVLPTEEEQANATGSS
jgi:hypothetical protein